LSTEKWEILKIAWSANGIGYNKLGNASSEIEPAAMKMESISIIDVDRGPQIAGSRLTVLDVFYYLHRGHDFDFVHLDLPGLSRAEFDAIVEYVNQHRDELIEKDRRAEEFIQRGIAEHKAKGLYHEIDESVPLKERIARLKEKMPPATGVRAM